MTKTYIRIATVFSVVALFIIGVALVSKIFTGSGESSLTYKIVGLYSYRVLDIGLNLLIVSLLPYWINYFKKLKYWDINAITDIDNPKLGIVLNYLAFILISLFFFKKREMLLFTSGDGDYMLSIFKQQQLWLESITYFGGNFFQSLGGNVWFPLNTRIDPGYIAAGLTGTLGIAVAHTVWATLLFTSTIVLSRTIRLSWLISILAAWLVPLLVIYLLPIGFYNVARLIPHVATMITISNFLIALLLWNQQILRYAIIRSALLFILVAYLLMLNPTMLILILPITGLIVLFKIILLPTTKERLNELAVITIPLIVLYFTGSIHFLAGLFLNTAVNMFTAEFVSDRSNVAFISTIFHGAGLFSVIFALVGFVYILQQKQKSFELKVLILSSTLLVFLIFTCGSITLFTDVYKGPSPIYFEFFVWPIYCISLALLVSIGLEIFRKKLHNRLVLSQFINHRQFLIHSVYIIPVLALYIYTVTLPATSSKWLFPPPQGKIMNILKSVSYKPGDSYKGRVATFTGLDLKGSVNWGNLETLDGEYLEKFNNDFRKAGMWVNNIPTFTEYSSCISPRFYFVTTRLFGRHGDSQIRSSMTLRHVDQKNLKLFGIRYLITDRPLDGLVADAYEESGKLKIFCYHLDNPNLGDWSPTNVIINKDPYATIQLMMSEQFDPRYSVVLDKSVNVELTPAHNSNFYIDKNKYRISALSDSYSLLIIPIEYSSCFDIDLKSTSLFKPKILIANQLLTAILFKKNVKGSLQYKNGPFINSRGRVDDYFVFKNLLKQYK